MRFINKTGVDVMFRVLDLNRFDNDGNPVLALGNTLLGKNGDVNVGFQPDGDKNYQARWFAQNRADPAQVGQNDVVISLESVDQDVDVIFN